MLEEMYSSPDGGKEMPKSMEGHEEHLKRLKTNENVHACNCYSQLST